jgi:hypothetical protein
MRSVRKRTEVLVTAQHAHLAEDPFAPFEDIARRPIDMQPIGVWQHGREERRIGGGEIRSTGVKIQAGGGLDAVHAGPELHDVQIGF